MSGTGFVSSGPLSYTLTAGKTYLLAVTIWGGNSIAYFDYDPFIHNASFGSLLGHIDTNTDTTLQSPSIDSGALNQMKVTTELP